MIQLMSPPSCTLTQLFVDVAVGMILHEGLLQVHINMWQMPVKRKVFLPHVTVMGPLGSGLVHLVPSRFVHFFSVEAGCSYVETYHVLFHHVLFHHRIYATKNNLDTIRKRETDSALHSSAAWLYWKGIALRYLYLILLFILHSVLGYDELFCIHLMWIQHIKFRKDAHCKLLP